MAAKAKLTPKRTKQPAKLSKKPAISSRKALNKPETSPKARKYEGASKAKRLSRWNAGASSANDETKDGIVTLRNRSRDLRRNNPWAAKAISVIGSNVVGEGISTQFRNDKAEVAKRLEAQWKIWAETTEIDFDGRNTIYGLQKLAMEAVAESGEVLIRTRYNPDKDFPLQYQVLESDFLDSSQTFTAPNGNYVVQGIEFDSQGRRLAYHLFESHPGSSGDLLLGIEKKTNRVPADQVKHLFRMDRPGQARGIAWAAPVMVRIKDLDEFEDAQLIRQKIASCFTAFVRDISGEFADADEDDCSDLGDRLEPGLIEHLPPGKEIQFSNPPEVQNYGQFVTAHLRAIAAGYQITYESLTGDYSQVNFSSGRMGWIEFFRAVKMWREHIMFAHMLDPIAKEFVTMMTIMGTLTSGTSWIQVPPKREMIDPTKEIPATTDAIRAGLMTLNDALLEMGKDPKEHLKQYAEDQAELDKLGLILASDPRYEITLKSSAQGETNEPKNQNSSEPN